MAKPVSCFSCRKLFSEEEIVEEGGKKFSLKQVFECTKECRTEEDALMYARMSTGDAGWDPHRFCGYYEAIPEEPKSR